MSLAEPLVKRVNEISPVNDGANGKWLLKPDHKIPSASRYVDQFLKPLQGTIRLLGCVYNGSKLLSTSPFLDDELLLPGSKWNYKLIYELPKETELAKLNAKLGACRTL